MKQCEYSIDSDDDESNGQFLRQSAVDSGVARGGGGLGGGGGRGGGGGGGGDGGHGPPPQTFGGEFSN